MVKESCVKMEVRGGYNQDTFYTYILYIYELFIHMKISKNK